MAVTSHPVCDHLIPLARRLRLRLDVGVSIPFLGAAAGFAAAFFNPFTWHSRRACRIPLYSGLGYRMVSWVIGTTVMIAYVMLVRPRGQAEPGNQPCARHRLEREAVAMHDEAGGAWDLRHVATLSIFVASMVLLVVGVLQWKWYIDQIAMLFLGWASSWGLRAGSGQAVSQRPL